MQVHTKAEAAAAPRNIVRRVTEWIVMSLLPDFAILGGVYGVA